MKKLISLLVIGAFLFSSYGVVCVSANEIHTESLEYANNEFEISEREERKHICDATLDDDFEEDSVIVIFKNDKSRNFESHNAKSFPEVTAISVEDLTQHYKNRNEKHRNIDEQTKATLSSETSASNDEMYVDENKFHQIVKINLKSKGKENVLKYIKKLEARDDVLMAFPNYIYKSALTANDTGYEDDNDWAIEKINLPAAWNITTGSSSVKIGIIDSGIDANNPDLSARVSTTLGDCFTGIGTMLTDEGGHGTAVAGIAGAHGNNGKGVTGVCWRVTLVSLKAAVKSGNACTMSYENFVKAIKYATENNIPILNYSYNGIANRDEVVVALGNYAGLLVCAAGNEAKDISNDDSYEIDCDNMIVVTDTNKDDEIYSYTDSYGNTKGSNYSATRVDLAAPGYQIGTTSISEDNYTTASGTSIAAPFVAGVAALLKSQYPTMDAEGLKYYIEKGVDKIPALSGKVKTGGRLNAYKTFTSVHDFKVVYNPGEGGGGTMGNTTMYYGCETNLSANTFTRDTFGFNGWYAHRDSDDKWRYTNGTKRNWYKEGSQHSGYYKYTYSDEQILTRMSKVDGDIITMYAQWKRDCIIKFNSNNGTGSMSSMSISYGDSKSLRLNEFARSGCAFDHWYAKNQNNEIYYTNGTDSDWFTAATKPSGYIRVDIANGITVNDNTFESVCDGDIITLYAYWQPNTGILGDANQDGTINTQDATLIQKYINNQVAIDPDSNQWLLCDVNFDGNITVKDSTMISKYIAHLIDEFGE